MKTFAALLILFSGRPVPSSSAIKGSLILLVLGATVCHRCNAATFAPQSSLQNPSDSSKNQLNLVSENHSSGHMRPTATQLHQQSQLSQRRDQAGGSEFLSSNIQGNTRNQQPYRLNARFHLEQGTQQGYLILQVDLKPGAYVYSLTQGGDLKPSKVTVPPSKDFRVVGDFVSDIPPEVIENDPVFEQRLEKHRQTIQFFAPIETRAELPADQIVPELKFEGQVCTDEGICIPITNQIVRARFGGYFHRSAAKKNQSQNK